MPRLFGAKLRHLRLQHTMTQADLARQLSMKRAHINNLEADRRAPSLDFVLRAAKLFRVTTDYLLRDAVPIDHVSATALSSDSAPISGYHLLGSKLRYQRTRLNLTQEDVAAQLALASHSHISFLEASKKEPSLDLVVQIADVLRVTTDYLLWDILPVEITSEEPGS